MISRKPPEDCLISAVFSCEMACPLWYTTKSVELLIWIPRKAMELIGLLTKLIKIKIKIEINLQPSTLIAMGWIRLKNSLDI